MKRHTRVLLVLVFATSACLTAQVVIAQQSGGSSSRSDSSSRDERRDHERDRDREGYRSRYGDRGRGDWRSSRSRGGDERRSDDRRSDDRSSSSSGSSSSNSSSTSSGSSSRSSTSSSSTPSSGSSSSSTWSSGSSPNLQAWATSLVKQHDKNGNMILEPDEQGFLGSSAAAEDLNHDGKITIDEIVMHHSAGAPASTTPATTKTPTPASPTTSDSNRSGDRERSRGYGRHDRESGSDSRSKSDDPMAKRIFTGTAGGTGKDADKRHSYRFSTAADKLPTGLPSWFKSRDANGDGQVSLGEYSRTMSQSIVSEFRRYDLNDDGIVTAKEAAKVKQ